MSKQEKDIQREIYNFIEEMHIETGQGVKLQTLLDKFCQKYNVSETTITRYLEKMVHQKTPFRLKTWYDKSRYYGVWVITRGMVFIMLFSVVTPIASFFIDLYKASPFLVTDKVIALFVGFWLAMAYSHYSKNKNH